MQQILYLLILVVYLISLLSLGSIIVRKFFPGMATLLTFVGSTLMGIGVGVPITYVFSILFSRTNEPILWSTILFIGLSFILKGVVYTKKTNLHLSLTLSDLLIVIFSVIFSTWMMMKTFHAGAAGVLFVGSNNVFDFGHSLGIVRSFSWGNNIPFMSPFESGLPFFYHFFFYFFVAIWEYFGVPIVWAMNIPSILSFSSLLIMVYFLPQILLKQKKLVGWIAVLLTITHSTLTFWYLMIQKGFTLEFLRNIWRLPAYPFAGPFDGSVISIFMTLNNYVNQRHLAFGVALGLFLIMCLVTLFDDKQLTKFNSALLGLLTGGMFLWNIPVSAVTGAILVLSMLFKRRFKESILFSIFALIMLCVSVLPFVNEWKNVWSLAVVLQRAQVGHVPVWNIVQYVWENLGILPFIAFIGYFVTAKQRRNFITPFLLLFVLMCVYAAYGNHGFDQKFLSVFIIGVNVSAASGVAWLFQNRLKGLKLLSFAIICALTASGIVDLMAIKNEFAFPLVNSDTAPLISWIGKNTKREAIFVSYSDIIDPVVLAGRKNYFGFFGNVSSTDRSGNVSRIYQGDVTLAKKNKISYILVPTHTMSNFTYKVDMGRIRASASEVYEDTHYMLFKLK